MQGMFSEKESIVYTETREKSKKRNEIMDKLIAKETGKSMLEYTSSNTRDFLGKYNYEKRYKKYFDSLQNVSDRLTLKDREKIIRKQILRDITEKAFQKKNVSEDKVIQSLLKSISSDKVFKSDFETPDAKADILMEISRIKSIYGHDVKKESIEISKNDIIQNVNIGNTNITMNQNEEQVIFKTEITPLEPYVYFCHGGEEYTVLSTLDDNNFDIDDLKIDAMGNVSKSNDEGPIHTHAFNTNTPYERRRFRDGIAEETQNIVDKKENIMIRKKQATMEIDNLLDVQFSKYLNKSLDDVYNKKSRKERKVKYISNEGNILDKGTSNEILGMSPEMVEENPMKFANKFLEKVTKLKQTGEIDSITQPMNIVSRIGKYNYVAPANEKPMKEDVTEKLWDPNATEELTWDDAEVTEKIVWDPNETEKIVWDSNETEKLYDPDATEKLQTEIIQKELKKKDDGYER